MGKIFTIIIGLYILYYLANIIYDLFLNKDKSLAPEENVQTFSIGEEEDIDSLKNIEIDDVEKLKTPNSFNTNSAFEGSTNEESNSTDPEYWREKFEQEQSIEEYSVNTNNKQEKNNSVKWEEILNKAETKVHMVSNLEGYKVYKSFN